MQIHRFQKLFHSQLSLLKDYHQLKVVYFDCFSGISGDMVLGALVDTGIAPEYIKTELSKIRLDEEFSLDFHKTEKHGISGTQAKVKIREQTQESNPHKHSHILSRHLSDIRNLIDTSELESTVRAKSKSIFDRLAEAEAKVHNTEKEKVHLHEVSGIDSIVDIVGAVIGLHKLGVEKIYASPLSLGHGFVECSHGMMPVPVPGTMELLHDVPIRQTDIPQELVTPTGAAIITTLADRFGVMPNMRLFNVGYGAGSRDLRMQPNLLRICIGEISTLPETNDSIEIIETNVDDMSPEVSGYVMEQLFDSGALDVFFAPLLMKKGRPAIQISVISSAENRQKLIRILLTETTTFGVRYYAADRVILKREIVEIATQWGPIRAKRGFLNGLSIKTVPEYEDCKKIAERTSVPLQTVFQEALRNI